MEGTKLEAGVLFVKVAGRHHLHYDISFGVYKQINKVEVLSLE